MGKKEIKFEIVGEIDLEAVAEWFVRYIQENNIVQEFENVDEENDARTMILKQKHKLNCAFFIIDLILLFIVNKKLLL